VQTLQGSTVTATSAVVSGYTRLPDVTGLAFTSRTPSSVGLQWNALTGATGYRIDRYNETIDDWETVAANHSGTTFTDTTVSPLTEYHYLVTGVNANTESMGAPEIFGATPGSTLPSGWTSQDIGSVGGLGAAGYDSGTFTVIGSGTNIWNPADEFQFVHTTMTGDGFIEARVVSLEDYHDGWSIAGVMIRETLSNTSKYAMMDVTFSQVAQFQWRTTSGGSSGYVDGPAVTAPYYVRVTRSGNTLTGQISANGSSWTTVGSITISMTSTVFIGLAVTATDNERLNTAVFDNVDSSATGPLLLMGGGGSEEGSAGGSSAKSRGGRAVGSEFVAGSGGRSSSAAHQLGTLRQLDSLLAESEFGSRSRNLSTAVAAIAESLDTKPTRRGARWLMRPAIVDSLFEI
jgi:hypothetical protein